MIKYFDFLEKLTDDYNKKYKVAPKLINSNYSIYNLLEYLKERHKKVRYIYRIYMDLFQEYGRFFIVDYYHEKELLLIIKRVTYD